MIPRYADPRIETIFSDEAKLLRWQDLELAVIRARVEAGIVSRETYNTIKECLLTNPPDVDWWKIKDAEVKHDLNAFIAERRRFIPAGLEHEFHRDMTSYDTEEAPFVLSLQAATTLIEMEFRKFERALTGQADLHRHTLMLDRTHGQWAKLRTFGSRMLTWHAEFVGVKAMLFNANNLLRYSRMSGAVGNYGGNLTPKLEEDTLAQFRLSPFYGATQIMPRTMYAPLAQSLQLMCHGLAKVAMDIRLGARSGNPILQEPFAKKQMGSSAMPHKKNPITLEQMAGMLRLADSHAQAIVANCQTWESRAIEQSSVERVAWPDLFHVTLRMITSMTRVMEGLTVNKDNMLREIAESRGAYASDEARNFLAAEFAKRDIPAEVAYRIVQLACFDVARSSDEWLQLRDFEAHSLEDADTCLQSAHFVHSEPVEVQNIKFVIQSAQLFWVNDLAANQADVDTWNEILGDLFKDQQVTERWHELFLPSRLLANEEILFLKLLDV